MKTKVEIKHVRIASSACACAYSIYYVAGGSTALACSTCCLSSECRSSLFRAVSEVGDRREMNSPSLELGERKWIHLPARTHARAGKIQGIAGRASHLALHSLSLRWVGDWRRRPRTRTPPRTFEKRNGRGQRQRTSGLHLIDDRWKPKSERVKIRCGRRTEYADEKAGRLIRAINENIRPSARLPRFTEVAGEGTGAK